jgi:hypothetical protein
MGEMNQTHPRAAKWLDSIQETPGTCGEAIKARKCSRERYIV